MNIILQHAQQLAVNWIEEEYEGFEDEYKQKVLSAKTEKEIWLAIPFNYTKSIVSTLKEHYPIKELAPHLAVCVETTQLDFLDVFEEWTSEDLTTLFYQNPNYWTYYLSMFERLNIVSSIDMRYVLDIGSECTGLRIQKDYTLQQLIMMSSCKPHVVTYYEQDYRIYLEEVLSNYQVCLDSEGHLILPLQQRVEEDPSWGPMCQQLLDDELYRYACTLQYEQEWHVLLAGTAMCTVNLYDYRATRNHIEIPLQF